MFTCHHKGEIEKSNKTVLPSDIYICIHSSPLSLFLPSGICLQFLSWTSNALFKQ